MEKSLVSTSFHFNKQKSFYRGKVRDVYNINDGSNIEEPPFVPLFVPGENERLDPMPCGIEKLGLLANQSILTLIKVTILLDARPRCLNLGD
jgi:hypothetical protein